MILVIINTLTLYVIQYNENAGLKFYDDEDVCDVCGLYFYLNFKKKTRPMN